MSRLPVRVMTDAALRQRRDELVAARRRIDAEVERITTALLLRRPDPPPPPVRHGTTWAYRTGCRCAPCKAANAAEKARDRARRKEREMKAAAKYERIGRPRVELAPGPNGLVFAMCRHCPWQEGPSVKTYMQERAAAHRADHRTGRIAPR